MCLCCREEDLVVKINEEVFYTKRLPDTVIRDQCEVQGVKQKKGKSQVKILLVKENNGIWIDKFWSRRWNWI